MSAWYDVNIDDIDIDQANKEVNLFVCSNEHGNVYLIMSFDQIDKIASKINESKTKASDEELLRRFNERLNGRLNEEFPLKSLPVRKE